MADVTITPSRVSGAEPRGSRAVRLALLLAATFFVGGFATMSLFRAAYNRSLAKLGVGEAPRRVPSVEARHADEAAKEELLAAKVSWRAALATGVTQAYPLGDGARFALAYVHAHEGE